MGCVVCSILWSEARETITKLRDPLRSVEKSIVNDGMHGPITHARNIDSVLNDISRYLRDLLVCDTCKFWWCLICVFATRAKKNPGENTGASAPSSTGYCQRRHQSVNNVKPVGFEFNIWVVDMLSVCWERGTCAVALMLRADIAIKNSLLTRVDVRWERGACTVALVLRADILSPTFTSARSLQSKTPYSLPDDRSGPLVNVLRNRRSYSLGQYHELRQPS